MTIEYIGIAVYGLSFRDYSTALSWLSSHNIDSDSLGGIAFNDNPHQLCISNLNAFTGEGCVVGFPFILGESVDRYQQQWFALFPKEVEKIPQAFIDVLVM